MGSSWKIQRQLIIALMHSYRMTDEYKQKKKLEEEAAAAASAAAAPIKPT